MASLKIITCNVCGLSDVKKRKQIFQMLKEKKYDIVFLQEVHSTKKMAKYWRNQWGSRVLFSHGDSNARGTAILFNKNIDCTINKTIIDEQGRFVLCRITVEDKTILLCNCYAPNEDDVDYWSQVCEQLLKFDETDLVIWGGDFNVMLTDQDKKGKFVMSKSAEYINEFMEQNEWTDVWRYLNPDRF